MYLLGPMVFFYFRNLLSDRHGFRPRDLLFIAPSAAVFIAFIPYYILPDGEKLRLFPIDIKAEGFVKVACIATEHAMLIWIGFCFLLAYLHTRYLRNKKIPIMRVIAKYLAAGIALSISLAYSDIFQKIGLYRINMLLTLVLVVVPAFLTFREP